MRELSPAGRTALSLSRRALQELSTLQASGRSLSAPRHTALRIFIASRHATTALAQRDFWLEFSWLDQEYRTAVRRLARFCQKHRDGAAARC